MSQQTQVPRVVEYHQRWVARWPTVQVRALRLSALLVLIVLVPYYEAFLVALSHGLMCFCRSLCMLIRSDAVQALAEASQDEVNELWAGASNPRFLLNCLAGFMTITSALPLAFCASGASGAAAWCRSLENHLEYMTLASGFETA